MILDKVTSARRLVLSTASLTLSERSELTYIIYTYMYAEEILEEAKLDSAVTDNSSLVKYIDCNGCMAIMHSLYFGYLFHCLELSMQIH